MNKNIFIQAWDFIVQPHESVSKVSDRRRALLTASLAFITMLFLGIAFISIIGRGGFGERGTNNLFIVVAAIAIAYALSRTRYFALGSILLPVTLILYGFLDIPNVIAEEGVVPAFSYFNVLILLALVIANSILATELISVLVVGSIFGYLYLIISNNIGFAAIGADFGTFTTIAVLIAITNGYRALTDRQAFQEIERVNADLREASVELEKKVEIRTQELNRRSTLLEAAAYVSRQASGIQDLEILLDETAQLITDRFGYYHAGIFLADENNRNVVLQAASSEGGKKMLVNGHTLEIGRQGLVGYAAFMKAARIAQDVGTDGIYFNNPNLPNTRAEMALPLIIQNKLIGVLDIQSEDINAFSSDDIYTLQTMADQIALAIENARLLNQSREALNQSQEFLIQRTKSNWKQKLSQEEALRATYTPLGFSNAPSRTDVHTGHELRIPILLRGQKLGDILLRRKKNAPDWDAKEMEMAEKVTTQVALALENARLLEESQIQTERAQTISHISNEFSESLDIQTLLQKAVREIQQLPQVTEASIIVTPSSQEK